MPSPFPGFDPYLEDPHSWSTVHAPLIVDIARALHRRLPRGFTARVEQRLTVEGPDNAMISGANVPDTRQPDVTVFEQDWDGVVQFADKYLAPVSRPLREPEVVTQNDLQQRFVRVYDRRGGRREVVAIVELLSPTNKDGADGTAQYRRKQREARQAGVHLLEIDLLRTGANAVYVPKAVLDESGAYDYLLTLADAAHPSEYRFWRVDLRESLPAFALPLTPDVEPVQLDLQEVFTACYDASGLGDDIDYRKEPTPPLSPGDAAWANSLLKAAGLRV